MKLRPNIRFQSACLPLFIATCLGLPGLSAPAPDKTYDARIEGAQILTPAPGPTPAINGPDVYGVRPGSPVIYRIPTTGRRPIQFQREEPTRHSPNRSVERRRFRPGTHRIRVAMT